MEPFMPPPKTTMKKMKPLRLAMDRVDVERMVLALVPILQELREECAPVPPEDFFETVVTVMTNSVIALETAEQGHGMFGRDVFRHIRLLNCWTICEETVH
jgi:hypothetical protein